MEIFIFIGIGSIAFFVIIAVLFYKTYEAPRVRAGKQGEKAATEIIKQVLQDMGDVPGNNLDTGGSRRK